jgi:hypothetical protein
VPASTGSRTRTTHERRTGRRRAQLDVRGFWYQVKPFSTSENADTQVWALMMVLTLGLMFLPWIPGLRSVPRLLPVHRLSWRDHYRPSR